MEIEYKDTKVKFEWADLAYLGLKTPEEIKDFVARLDPSVSTAPAGFAPKANAKTGL